MTKPILLGRMQTRARLLAPVIDEFTDDRPAGRVLGTAATTGARRLGRDLERQMAIDHGALRFQPLVTPGWQRQGIAYGPFRRSPGLTLAVAVTNGHNTSQGSRLPEDLARRVWRWARGPEADPLPQRLWRALGPGQRSRVLRRFLWWFRSWGALYNHPDYNENLAVGWFTSEAPSDPLTDGCAFIMHAAEGNNGELWARTGERCLSAFNRLQNLQVFYLIAQRERGAIYYVAASEGAVGPAALPMMRPVAIDAFNTDATLFAGIHQCALGQIGFRVDTRVHKVQVEHVSSLSGRFSGSHAADHLSGSGSLDGETPDGWRVLRGQVERTGSGARAAVGEALAIRRPTAPSGLLHALVEAAGGAFGLVWRAEDENNYWRLTLHPAGATLVRVEMGAGRTIATDEACVLKPELVHSVQILDSGSEFGCYVDGARLFGRWFKEEFLAGASGVGLWWGVDGGASVRDFEAHPRAVQVPPSIAFEPPWSRVGSRVVIADDFAGSAPELAGHPVASGEGAWEKTLGQGVVSLQGGAAQVRASVEAPNPGRTLYTLPWSTGDFADLAVTITPPGSARGQRHRCRGGLVVWQDNDNYLTFTTYLDDSYNGASIALFTKRNGFEELYDAIWTMLGDRVVWGRPFDLRVTFDGLRFVIHIDGEPVLQRSLTDLYPEDTGMRITRVGIAVNWEWGDDTGSTFSAFRARS
jgi:hypothetical protein